MRFGIGIAFFSLALSLCLAQSPPQKTDLAPTPPMGWNSWNYFGRNVNEADVRAAADAMVTSGMSKVGYVYVNVDGSWQGKRDANGVLHTNAKFPDMKGLGEYIHSKGLKFGMYSGPGRFTCGGDIASYGHEYQDAKMFASWGVDLLKYDLCQFKQMMKQEAPNDPAKQYQMMRQAYEKMHQALVATGRPILFSLCQYGLDEVWKWSPEVGGTMWRTGHDIKPTYFSISEIGFAQAGLSKYAGPGRWNDPDILEVGNGHLSPDEEKTHMSLWAILAAPLLAGNDLPKMTEETKSILMNREVIAVDQDPLGKEGDRVWAQGRLELWSKPLQGGAMAVGLFNRLSGPTHMTFHLSQLGWKGSADARDLWAHKDVGVIKDSYSVWVPRHGVVLLRLTHP